MTGSEFTEVGRNHSGVLLAFSRAKCWGASDSSFRIINRSARLSLRNMRPPLSCLPLALLFLVSAVPSNAQKGGGERTQTAVEGAPLAVECELRVEQRAEWRLEGRAPPPDMRASEAPSPGGGLTARLAADAARPHHAGQYACSRAPDAPRVRVRLLPAGTPPPAVVCSAWPSRSVPVVVRSVAPAAGRERLSRRLCGTIRRLP
ncbi:uncharacterized protein LOC113234203 [Hyposmocoma kahamanoa]|uniref:uncharacterized protein LOC113234203 n=1 Tax=Hyposmocoma kahamanoa TaxID=1477025 RepID=UPI000E6D8090|nr:uncharacterized protein LOC113234203 [Hyposmocoma kahamanoa]